uniref:Uncharacterized protein n=1 Tax=Solanum lycopersicum TaxID=4081 RepID=K4DGA8_SOLLC
MTDHEKKKRSAFHNVNFLVEPFKSETNCHTIYNPRAVSTNYAEELVCDCLNRKYKEMLHGWVAENRQRENGSGAFDLNVQLIVEGLVGDDKNDSNCANGDSNEGGRCHGDDSDRK